MTIFASFFYFSKWAYSISAQSIKGYSRKKYLGEGRERGDGRRYIFLWVVGAESFQSIWVIGSTKSNYMGGWCFAAWKGKIEYYLHKKERSFYLI